MNMTDSQGVKSKMECKSKECAFQQKHMANYPSPCRHCGRNEKRFDDQGDFYIGKRNY